MPGFDWRGIGRAFARGQSGSVSVLTVIFSGCLLASLVVSIDLANLYLMRRQQQSALDLAALAAARDLSGAESAARASLSQNGVPVPTTLAATLGRYTPDLSVSDGRRFVPGAQPPNAVHLQMTAPSRLFFARALLPAAPTLTTRSTSVNTRVVAFTIGSRLASLQGGAVNALLSALVGGSVTLSAMDYKALADARIDLPKLLGAVASQARLTALTYDDVLDASVSLRALGDALVDTATLTASAKFALQQLTRASNGKVVTLGKMVSLGEFGSVKLGGDVGVSATASVLETLTTALGVANGRNQIDFDLGVAAPGLLGLSASLVIGERAQSSPWFALGREGATVRTAQTRLRLVARVGGALGLASLNLPVAVDVAAGSATLVGARCGRVPATEVEATLSVLPAVAKVWIGEPKQLSAWNDMTRPADVGPATVVDTLLLSARASAYVGVENLKAERVAFNAADIAAGTLKSVKTTTPVESTLGSLTRNLSMTVDLKLLGIGLGTPKAVGDTLAATLSPAGALLDPILIALLDLVGVRIGEADVAVRGLRCDGSALVQ